MSAQVPETYIILRSALENALYGYYFHCSPASRKTWLRRHDNAEYKKKVKNEFQIRRLLIELAKSSRFQAQKLEKLYDRTIDYGAHPNERGLFQSLHG